MSVETRDIRIDRSRYGIVIPAPEAILLGLVAFTGIRGNHSLCFSCARHLYWLIGLLLVGRFWGRRIFGNTQRQINQLADRLKFLTACLLRFIGIQHAPSCLGTHPNVGLRDTRGEECQDQG